MTRRFELALEPEYLQFYLGDGSADLVDLEWTEETDRLLLIAAPGIVGVGTISCRAVPVVLEIATEAPEDDLRPWDQVLECSLTASTDFLVVAQLFDNGVPDARRFDLKRGTYRVRVYYGDLDTAVSNGFGSDHYRIVLWPGAPGAVQVLKSRKLTLQAH